MAGVRQSLIILRRLRDLMDDRFEKDSTIFKKPDEFEEPKAGAKWDGVAVEDYMLKSLEAGRSYGKFVSILIKWCPESWQKAQDRFKNERKK